MTPTNRLALALDAVCHACGDGKLLASSRENIARWLQSPAFADYHQPLIELVERGEWKTLDTWFWQTIPFGTGGRRGLMAPLGSATMNARTIAESAYGLAVYARKATQGRAHRAAVAYDSRLRSAEFARLTACVLAGQGFTVSLFGEHRATPELSFAIRHLQCDVGVVISASHNPPSDNGFKAYWSDGAQVLPPHDEGIIAEVYAAEAIPLANYAAAVASGQIVPLGEETDRQYVAAVCDLGLSSARDIQALYTPLHGVGETSVYRVLHAAGFKNVRIFEPQRAADGNFPNVPDHLPNPERSAVFTPALAEAARRRDDLVLASDPDADRMAIAVRNRSGDYACVTGNQLSALLTDYILSRRLRQHRLTPPDYIVTTLVTSRLVGRIGRAYDTDVVEDCLVGFKHMAEVVRLRGAEHFVYATEESLGYMVGDYARDKDAAIAALYVLEFAAELKQQGKTLLDREAELHAALGVHKESQVNLVRPGPEGCVEIDRLMCGMRKHPPTQVGAITLRRVLDYQTHEIRGLPDNGPIAPLPRPDHNLLIFEGEHAGISLRAALRPSGTEPKAKLYFFAEAPPLGPPPHRPTASTPLQPGPHDRATLAAQATEATRLLKELETGFVRYAEQVMAGSST